MTSTNTPTTRNPTTHATPPPHRRPQTILGTPRRPPLVEALAEKPYIAPGWNAPAAASVGPYTRDDGGVDVEEWPWLVTRIEYRGRGRSRYWVGLRRDVAAVPVNGRRFRTYDAVRHLRRVTAMDRGAALLDRVAALIGLGSPEPTPDDYGLAGGR